MNEPSLAEPLFSAEDDIISTYTRREAIEDGALVALDPGVAREAGIRLPVAVSLRVHAECIALTPAAEAAWNDVRGRTWDVLYMAAGAMRRAAKASDVGSVIFELYVVRDAIEPTPTHLKATIGPGDDGEPVITILFPEED